MTNSSKKIPMAHDSTSDKPRSSWDKQVMRQSTSSLVADKAADSRRQRAAEAAAAQRLTPYNRLTDWLVKAYASPLTAAGSLAGAANVAAARIAGDERAKISVSDNGIQFESGYFGDKDRAFTLGNAVLHGPESRPGDPNIRAVSDEISGLHRPISARSL